MADPTPVRRPLPGGPRHPANFPDPFVLHEGTGRWFAYATNDNGCHVQLLRSNDLVTWNGPTDALPHVARWAEANRIWSPAVARIGDGYVLWYSVHKRGSTRQARRRLYVARVGFVDGRPVLTDRRPRPSRRRWWPFG